MEMDRVTADDRSDHYLQPKHKKIDELKVALQTIWEELPQEHINKAVANFTKRSTACVAAITVVVIFSIRSNFVYLNVCILVSSPTNRHMDAPP